MTRRILIALMIVSFPIAARASVPPLLNYQGVLRDAVGDVVPDGDYSVTFRIWDAESGGVALWQEGRLVAAQGGLFTVLLGSIVPIPDTLFSRPDRWIALQVGLDAEMSPRQRLVTVPYSWHAVRAADADSATTARTVDTSGYSAYADLLSEDRIGIGPGQVAPGDSLHAPVIVSTGLYRIEDTSSVSLSTSNPGTYVLKQLTIPAGEVGHYLRIALSAQSVGNSGSHGFAVYVNGGQVYPSCGGPRGDINVAWSIELTRLEVGRWFICALDPYPTFGCPSVSNGALDGTVPYQLITVEHRATKSDNSPAIFKAGEMIVIYDKD